MATSKTTLLIACGALAREITWLIDTNGWRGVEVTCLPADLHNYPKKIPDGMRDKIRAAKATGRYGKILALYADCGTGGMLDAVLKEEGVERIPGAHCYEFYTGSQAFMEMAEEELGTLYLTDYLTRFFDRLIISGLGLDRHPELRNDYFGNYTRIVYLAQTEDAELVEKARAAADRLDLAFEVRQTGMGGLAEFIESHIEKDGKNGETDSRLLA